MSKWEKLLSTDRVGGQRETKRVEPVRTQFQRDYDRIIFSSAFRRMQDKTQVFPLSSNDYTRTRLTHSLEVSSVGRSLGREAARILDEEGRSGRSLTPDDFGTLVAAACLAHDIGNPPFGHSGEYAIQRWVAMKVPTLLHDSPVSARTPLSPQQHSDLARWEGNAQGVRVLCRLQGRRRSGGLRLTKATIGTMMKYPCCSLLSQREKAAGGVSRKKFGYFQTEGTMIEEVLSDLGLRETSPGAFTRHPLAYLVEAADDVCYATIDLEDSVDQGIVSVSRALDAYRPIAERVAGFKDYPYENEHRIKRLRTYTIQALMDSCIEVFRDELDRIEKGVFDKSLIEACDLGDDYEELQSPVREQAYTDSRVLQIEAAGFEVIGGLMDIFATAVLEPFDERDRKLLELLPISYLQPGGKSFILNRQKALSHLTAYQRLLALADYVSGMTDTYAVGLYQKLSGIRLPD